MSKAGIAWIIVQESMLICFGGIVLGILSTIGLKFVLTKLTNLNVQIEFHIIFLIAVVGISSGIIGALYPALRAARLDAVEALSYE